MSDSLKVVKYGHQDASFKAAGEEAGVFKLVECFYELMVTEDEFKIIREMHPSDLSVSIDKLARFLCGWLGGPRLYAEKYGSISIPVFHRHLAITGVERDMWLQCMAKAAEQQDYDKTFKVYLIEQLAVPAERIRQASQQSQ